MRITWVAFKLGLLPWSYPRTIKSEATEVSPGLWVFFFFFHFLSDSVVQLGLRTFVLVKGKEDSLCLPPVEGGDVIPDRKGHPGLLPPSSSHVVRALRLPTLGRGMQSGAPSLGVVIKI